MALAQTAAPTIELERGATTDADVAFADQRPGARASTGRYRGRQKGGALSVDTSIPALPILLTVEEASAALQLSAASVLKAIDADEILAYRLGRGYRIPSGGLFEKARSAFDGEA